MKFFETPEGQDFNELWHAVTDIDVTHTLYMCEVLEFMRMMQMYNDTNKTPEQEKSARSLIKRQAVSLTSRPPFATLVALAPKYDYEFLPTLINQWAQQ